MDAPASESELLKGEFDSASNGNFLYCTTIRPYRCYATGTRSAVNGSSCREGDERYCSAAGERLRRFRTALHRTRSGQGRPLRRPAGSCRPAAVIRTALERVQGVCCGKDRK